MECRVKGCSIYGMHGGGVCYVYHVVHYRGDYSMREKRRQQLDQKQGQKIIESMWVTLLEAGLFGENYAR